METMLKAETLRNSHAPSAKNIEERTCHWSKASRKDSPPAAGRGPGSTLKLPPLSLPAMLGGTCTNHTNSSFPKCLWEIRLGLSSFATSTELPDFLSKSDLRQALLPLQPKFVSPAHARAQVRRG